MESGFLGYGPCHSAKIPKLQKGTFPMCIKLKDCQDPLQLSIMFMPNTEKATCLGFNIELCHLLCGWVFFKARKIL